MDLSPRLSALAQLVVEGQPAADIGCDHGLLACALVLDKVVPRAIASDVAAAPLEGARSLAKRRWRTRRRVEVRQGDGLTTLQPGEVGTIVIAGMGGARILRILDAAPEVVAATRRLVLQPNTDVPDVRAWAAGRGHALEDERLVLDQGRWYVALAVQPGAATEPQPWDAWDLAWGPLLRARRDPALRRFLGAELPRVAKALAQARAGGASSEAQAPLAAELDAIEQELAVLSMAPGALHGRGTVGLQA